MIELKGIPASEGIALGPLMIKKDEINPSLEIINNIDYEKKRFKEARENAIKQLNNLYEKTLIRLGEKEASIFTAHIALIEDYELIANVESFIEEQSWNAEWALKKTTDNFIDIFNGMQDPYLRERALDIKDIYNRIQKHLMGNVDEDYLEVIEPVIIIAHDLTPSDTALIDTSKVIGFITEVGGSTSHTAILARTLEIPAVVGVPDIISKVKNGQTLVIDGVNGVVTVDPSDDTIEYYQNEKSKIEARKEKLKLLKNTLAITKDGVKIELGANIGTPKDIKNVIDKNPNGIGLFRTEFIYMGRESVPLEEEQFEAYKEVARAMMGKPVVIRTLDIGGDKELKYLDIDKEMNPFLGFRAIRLCLERVELWKTQLRALLRASVFGDIKIMFPMISTYKELQQAKAILNEVKLDLTQNNIPFNEKIQIGMMMETPAAAIMADSFAKEVDFFSIGTNDLIQYTIAVDRMNPLVSHLYSPYDPAVIRLIKTIIDAGHKEGIWVGMCGEAASDLKAIPLWLGLGLDELSMSASSLLEVKHLIRNLEMSEAIDLSNNILRLNTAFEIRNYLEEYSTNMLVPTF